MEHQTEQPLNQELVLLEDAFAEHTCISAFVLTALTAVMSSEEPIPQQVIEGAKLCAAMLQSRTLELKESLGHMRERYLAERKD